MAGLALLEGLAHAEHDLEVMGQGEVDLAGNEFIGLVEYVSALGMAAQGPLAAAVMHHGRGNLTGEGAVFRGVEILNTRLKAAHGGAGHDVERRGRR